MTSIGYRPGELVALLNDSLVILAQERQLETLRKIWNDAKTGDELIDVLHLLTADGLGEAPSFVCVGWGTKGCQVIVRGSLAVSVKSESVDDTWDGTSTLTWSEHGYLLDETLSISIGAESLESGDFPVTQGIVPASGIRIAEFSVPQESMEVQASDVGPDAVDELEMDDSSGQVEPAELEDSTGDPVGEESDDHAPLAVDEPREMFHEWSPFAEVEADSGELDFTLPRSYSNGTSSNGVAAGTHFHGDSTDYPSTDSHESELSVAELNDHVDTIVGGIPVQDSNPAEVESPDPSGADEDFSQHTTVSADRDYDSLFEKVTEPQTEQLSAASSAISGGDADLVARDWTTDRSSTSAHSNGGEERKAQVHGRRKLVGRRSTTRPRLSATFVLQLATGEMHRVLGATYLGRAPQARSAPAGELPQLITVPGEFADISRTHLEFQLDGGVLMVTDVSTNGAVLRRPDGDKERLPRKVAVPVGTGSVLDLGDGMVITVAKEGA